MTFLKKHIFTVTRFLTVYLAVFAIYNLSANKSDLISNTITLLIGITLTILITMIEYWYGLSNSGKN